MEAEWRDRFGSDLIAELRAQLDPVAGAASPDLPDHVLAALHRG